VRVLFAGTTGIRKGDAVRAITVRALREAGLSSDPDNMNSRNFIRFYDFERSLEQKNQFALWTYLTSLNTKEQQRRWHEAFADILHEIQTESPKNVLLSLHMTFFKNSRFFSLVDQDLLKKFKPDLFITFIDDLYAVWARVENKTKLGQDLGQSHLRLREILAWRTVETLVTDFVSKNFNVPNYVVAVKHPVDTVFRLAFQSRVKCFYASFPISQTRSDPRKREEIDNFRLRLHKDYAVFDPLTIDEKIIPFSLEKAGKKKGSIEKGDRWPIPIGFSMVGDDDILFPIELKSSDINEVIEDIDEHVKFRDYRLVSQSDALVAYRPYYGKRMHEGVKSEIDFATDLMKERYFYFPKEDGEKNTSPFKAGGSPYKKLDGLFDALRKLKGTDERRWISDPQLSPAHA
jgi:hypothetical protein